MLKDSYHQMGLREHLANLLREKGITDPLVLDAIRRVPRHFFVEKTFEYLAYEDRALPIGAGQTISQPFTVAFQTQLLGVQKRDVVLEIGTGSGYQAAILAAMGARVFTLERIFELHQRATEVFLQLNLPQIRTYFKDGNNGLPAFAPFHKIIVTAGATEVPNALKEQLRIGGVLVIPVGNRQQQTMLRIQKASEEIYEVEEFGTFSFVPMLPKRME